MNTFMIMIHGTRTGCTSVNGWLAEAPVQRPERVGQRSTAELRAGCWKLPQEQVRVGCEHRLRLAGQRHRRQPEAVERVGVRRRRQVAERGGGTNGPRS